MDCNQNVYDGREDMCDILNKVLGDVFSNKVADLSRNLKDIREHA